MRTGRISRLFNRIANILTLGMLNRHRRRHGRRM